MRILCVMAFPLAILLVDFWILKLWYLEKQEISGWEKFQEWKIFFWLSAVLLILLGVRLAWAYPGQAVLFQCKRMGCMALLAAAAAVDFRQKVIPNHLLLSGVAVRVVLLAAELIFEREEIVATILSELLGAVGIFFVCMVFLLLMKNSIGMGDVKLFMVMGLYLGLYSMMNAIMSSLVIAFISAVILLLAHRKGKKDSLPFAPAVLAGTYLSIFLTGI